MIPPGGYRTPGRLSSISLAASGPLRSPAASASSSKKGTFDISKIPDVYDCAKYDAIHNQKNLGLQQLTQLYDTSRILSEFIAPSEYGMTRKQKLDIGVTICKNLMKKISQDLESCLPKQAQVGGILLCLSI